MPSRCCSPSDSMRFQCASSSSRSASAGRPTAVIDFGEPRRGRRCRARPDRSTAAASVRDREIGPLRQHHHLGASRHDDRARAERPDAGDGAEQRRLAGARRAGDQHPLAAANRDVVGGDQRRAVRQAAPRGRRARSCVASPGATSMTGGVVAAARAAATAASKPASRSITARHSASCAVDGDEERQRRSARC